MGALRVPRIHIEPTILRKKIEDLMNVKGFGEKTFLKLKPLLTTGEKPGSN